MERREKERGCAVAADVAKKNKLGLDGGGFENNILLAFRIRFGSPIFRCVYTYVHGVNFTNTRSTATNTGRCSRTKRNVSVVKGSRRTCGGALAHVFRTFHFAIAFGDNVRLAAPPFLCAAHFAASGEDARDPLHSQ